MAGAQGIRAGRAFVEVGADDNRLARGLRSAQRRLQAFGSAVQRIGLRVAAGGVAMLAPIIASTRHYTALGSALFDMSKRTGMSVEALSALGFAADMTGASLETVETGLRRMQRTISDAVFGLKESKDALAELKLTADELKNLRPEDQFDLIAERMNAIANPTQRAAAAMKVFGRSGTQLLPMLAELSESRKQAGLLGLIVSTDAAERADDLGDAIDRLGKVGKNAAFWVGDALAPALTRAANVATALLMRVRDWMRANPRLVAGTAGAAGAIVVFGAALATAGIVVRVFAFAIGGLSLAMKGLALASRAAGRAVQFLLSRLFLVLTAVLAIGGAILHLTGQLEDLLKFAGRVFGGVAAEIDKAIEQFPALKAIKATVTGDIDFDFDPSELGRLSTAGTFNAFAVARMGGGQNTGERTAKASEEALRHLRRIEENTEQSGARFD